MQQRRTGVARALSVALCAGFALCAACVDPHPEPARDGLPRDLYAVAWLDARTAVAVGARGTLRRSDDAGAHWERLPSPVETGLYDVAFADTQRGWAVGQRSVILRTDDGGRSWVAQTHPRAGEGLPLLAVHALDPERAVAVGAWGARIFTRDGGVHWEDHSLVVTPEDPRFAWLDDADQVRVLAGERVYDDVTLQDVTCRAGPGRCWIVGEFGHVLSSEGGDGALAHGRIETGVSPLEVRFEAGSSELGAEVERDLAAWIEALTDTADARIELGWTLGPEARGAPDLAAAERALEAAEARLAAVRALLFEAGWQAERVREQTPIPWERLEAPDASADVTAWLGRHARERAAVTLTLRAEPMLFAVDFDSATRGLAVGGAGVWLETKDAGAHWRPARLHATDALFAVAHGPDGPLLAGAGPQLFARQSGTWRPVLATSGFVRDLAFHPGAPSVLAAGEDGQAIPVRLEGEAASPR
ncbi:MAG: YCF48-related protein [Myxococcota bacterium]